MTTNDRVEFLQRNVTAEVFLYERPDHAPLGRRPDVTAGERRQSTCTQLWTAHFGARQMIHATRRGASVLARELLVADRLECMRASRGC